MKLSQKASCTPHVHGVGIWKAKNDFGRSIKPRLDICIMLFALQDGSAKVDNFDSCLGSRLEQHVLWFDVRVDDRETFKIGESREHLDGESSDELHLHLLEVVELDEVVETDAHELEHHTLSYNTRTMCFRNTRKSFILMQFF